jgi:FkbM family methyltransferase
VKDALRRARRALRSVVGTDLYVRRQVRRPTELIGGRHGSGFGGWFVDPRPLHESSVVYSVGIGDDVSFDLALIDRIGCTVHAFDPTPESHRWLATQTLPPEFVVHEFGLANRNGVIPFFAHENQEWIAHSTIKSVHTVAGGVELPVRRLTTVMELLGHDWLDLLKLDIEGAEYEVIDDLVDSGIAVEQLLVEFHHNFPDLSPELSHGAIRRLNEHGLRIFHVGAASNDYSFVRV